MRLTMKVDILRRMETPHLHDVVEENLVTSKRWPRYGIWSSTTAQANHEALQRELDQCILLRSKTR